MPLYPVEVIVDNLPAGCVVHVDCRLTRRRDPTVLDDTIGHATMRVLYADAISVAVCNEKICETTVDLRIGDDGGVVGSNGRDSNPIFWRVGYLHVFDH